MLGRAKLSQALFRFFGFCLTLGFAMGGASLTPVVAQSGPPPPPPFQGLGDPRFADLFNNNDVCWILEIHEDAKPYPLGRPAGWVQHGVRQGLRFSEDDAANPQFVKNVIIKFEHGQTIVYEKGLKTIRHRRVPCPAGIGTELWLSFQISQSWLRLVSVEYNMAGQVKNWYSDTRDPIGFGMSVGYTFRPWSNSIAVSPFLSFYYLNMSVNHNFPTGSYLGTTSNFAGTAGVKIGPTLPNGVWIYGIGGVSMLNETLNVNFLPLASASTTTVPGATVGLGGAFQPRLLQGFGRSVSLFLEYQRTWWQAAKFDAPAASPLFNYSFRRADDNVILGVMIPLSASP